MTQRNNFVVDSLVESRFQGNILCNDKFSD